MEQRGSWGSRMGFILAAAGSAIGLGNIWKFPYMAGDNGGAAFIAIYLFMLATIGIVVLIAELALGRYTQSGAVGAFRKIDKRWSIVGKFGVAGAICLLGFYVVIGGWILKYLVIALTGGFNITDVGVTSEIFGAFTSSSVEPVVYTVVFVGICVGVLQLGVSTGIEKASKIMMPLLFAFLIILAINSLRLPGAKEGLEFLFKPDFSEVTWGTISGAMGQVFFTLSIGSAAMITYGSYLSKDEDIPKNAFIIVLLDTLVAIIAGLVIFPAVFTYGMDAAEGPGLLFVTLPAVFANMPFSNLIASLFFILVLVAALTSVISMMEAISSYFVEEHKKSRNSATAITTSIIMVLAVLSSLSQGVLSDVTILGGRDIFDTLSFISEGIFMPLAGLLTCIFVFKIWKKENAIHELTNEGSMEFKFAGTWSSLIKYVTPVGIALIFVQGLI